GRTGYVPWFAARQLELRAGPDIRGADGHELDLSAGVGVPVALLVLTVETLREIAAERHRQLERLTAVAKIHFALRRSIHPLRRRAGDRPPGRGPGGGTRPGRDPGRRPRGRAPRGRPRPPARARPPFLAPPRARTHEADRRRRRRRARTRADRAPARPRRRA